MKTEMMEIIRPRRKTPLTEGEKSYFHLLPTDGNSKLFLRFINQSLTSEEVTSFINYFLKESKYKDVICVMNIIDLDKYIYFGQYLFAYNYKKNKELIYDFTQEEQYDLNYPIWAIYKEQYNKKHLGERSDIIKCPGFVDNNCSIINIRFMCNHTCIYPHNLMDKVRRLS